MLSDDLRIVPLLLPLLSDDLRIADGAAVVVVVGDVGGGDASRAIAIPDGVPDARILYCIDPWLDVRLRVSLLGGAGGVVVVVF